MQQKAGVTVPAKILHTKTGFEEAEYCILKNGISVIKRQRIDRLVIDNFLQYDR